MAKTSYWERTFLLKGRKENQDEKENRRSLPQRTIADFEADLFGAIMEFQTRTVALVRRSSLDEKKQKLVLDRITTLLDVATAEVKRTKQWNLTEPLRAAYEDVERLVNELASSPDSGKNV